MRHLFRAITQGQVGWLLAGCALAAGCVSWEPAIKDDVTVGVIRWDAWHTPEEGAAHGRGGGPVKAMEESLNPHRYRHRAPFFARVDTNDTLRIDGYTQGIVDQEITFAKMGGIDYFAFLLYEENTSMSQGLSLYLSSARRRDVNFCAIASANTFEGAAKWQAGIERIVRLMKEPGYQTVCGGRPLLYLFRLEENWVSAWGGPEGARQLFGRLRAAVRAAGLGEPYLVSMQVSAEKAKRMADLIGADALSDYAQQKSGAGTPYEALAAHARAFWAACAGTGAAVVPLAMAGWDRRPRVEHPVPWETWQKPGIGLDSFYASPTPAELAEHIREAMDWSAAQPERSPAKTVLVYAWNEHDEGGWLCPTLGADGRPDAARLKAVSEMRSRRNRAARSEAGASR